MYGSKIVRSDGRVWMSPTLTPLVFQYKTVTSLSGGREFDTGLPPDRSPMVFVAYSKLVALVSTRVVRDNRVIYSFGGRGSDSNVTVYVFATGISKREAWGMSFYNANGAEIYNTANIPLSFEFLDTRNWNSDGSVALNYPPAIIPSYANVFTIPMPSGAKTLMYGYACYGNQISSILVNEINNGSGSLIMNNRVPIINRNLYG